MSGMNGWHLDKRVPITLVVVIGLQTSAAVWWAASMDARLTNVEVTLAVRGPVIDRFIKTEDAYSLLRNELLNRFDLITADFYRLEDKVDRLIESMPARRLQP